VGDFCSYLHVRGNLTGAERKQFDAVRGQCDQTAAQLRARMDALRNQFKQAMRGVPRSDWNTPENTAKWRAMYQEMMKEPAYKKLRESYDRSQKELRAFVDKGGSERGDAGVPHGYVWLFLRK
jgi:hypothetical protein